MFRTLYSKLAGVLLLLFLAVATALTLMTLHIFVAYNLETTQKLNQKLAYHLIEQNRLVTPQGYDTERLKSLFEMQMAINPSIEIYLLDNSGRVVEYSAAPGTVKLMQVSLEPIRKLVSGSARLPILGDDPRNPGTRKIFSVTAIPGADGDKGFLYVILASQAKDSIGGLLAGSYILRVTLGEIAVGVLFAGLAGMVVFAFMTRRLERLAEAMANFQHGEFSDVTIAELPPAGKNSDEIGRLTGTFREMSIRMVEQLRELRHNHVLRRELVANVSHDLKTPLAALQGYVDTLLLKDGSLTDEERRHYLQVASRSGERLGRLIGDLIELAKLDAREIKLSREAFPVAELMQDVMQKFQLKADQRQIRLSVNLPGSPPYVCADIGLIERVLENLIGNAIVHTGTGGRISLDLESGVEHAIVTVADSGCGIPEEEIPRIFDRFYRVNDEQRARGEHAGLGLAITKSILDLHESRIEVASSPGVGTEFRFSLPVAQAGSVECAA